MAFCISGIREKQFSIASISELHHKTFLEGVYTKAPIAPLLVIAPLSTLLMVPEEAYPMFPVIIPVISVITPLPPALGLPSTMSVSAV